MPEKYKEKRINRNLVLDIKAIDEENYTVDGVFSTDDVDRHKEVVRQDGWEVNEFMQNPVVLAFHDDRQPSIGRVERLEVKNGQLEGTIKFAVEENEVAETIFNLYAGGFMRAFSVGFRNLEYEVDQENDVIILTRNRLLEISAVNIGANARALAKSKGVDVSALDKLGKDVSKEKENNKDEVVVKLDPEIKQDLEQVKRSIKKIENEIGKGDIQDIKRSKPSEEKGGASAKSKRITKRQINRAVRSLLNVKKGISKN